MREVRKDYQALFATPQGKVIMKDLADQFDDSSVVEGDGLQTYGKSCAREVYLYIKYQSEEDE